MRVWLVASFSTVAVMATAAVALLFGSPPAQAEGILAGTTMTVHKSPACGCCGAYIGILREHGVEVTVVDTSNPSSIKAARGVPPSASSCHTTEVEGYVVEGHVPSEALERLVSERPEVDGIALPGMPAGSPGMNGVRASPFEVIAFDGQGTELFGRF